MKPARVLVVAAHPDDELLGCGAAVARHIAEGARAWTLVMAQGVAARPGLSAAETARQLASLRKDSARANRMLGVERSLLLDFPDNRLDTVPRLDLIQAIEAVVGRFRPDLVYTHSGADLNVDHQLVSEAVRTACRPLPGSSVREIRAFETASATEWRFDRERAFTPNLFVGVESFLAKKLAALACYKGEMRAFPHPRSPDYLRALAKTRGAQSGFRAAEAFVLVRRVEAR